MTNRITKISRMYEMQHRPDLAARTQKDRERQTSIMRRKTRQRRRRSMPLALKPVEVKSMTDERMEEMSRRELKRSAKALGAKTLFRSKKNLRTEIKDRLRRGGKG